jgi:hypothetical protein
MPEICRFYGIIIKMFFKEHNPPHIHAIYGEHIGSVDIQTLKMIEGDLPYRALSLVQEWISKNKKSLLKMWNTSKIRSLPPLK